MNKIKIFALLLIMVSFFLLLVGIGHLLYEKKNQILCQSYLHHWGTAFQIYRLYIQQECPKNLSMKTWPILLKSFLYKPEVAQCPSAFPKKGEYSYRFNQQAISRSFPKFQNMTQSVLLFDSCCSPLPFSKTKFPYHEIANRHLGGANLLLFDGHVSYCNAFQKGILLGKIGWKNSGGYSWP